MARIESLTPAHRDIFFVLLALGLLFAPIWLPVLHLGEPTYHYQRAHVTVGGENGLAYATSTPFKITGELISADIGCSVAEDTRVCPFERYLAANHTIPTGAFTTNPNLTERAYRMGSAGRYDYVLLNGTAYAATYVPNRSVQNDHGLYRLDLGLNQMPLDEVLNRVSLNATTQREEMPPVVYRAATEGVGKSHSRANVPQEPIRIENGTYYRVYFDARTEAPPIGQFLGTVLPVGTPVIGLLALYTLSRRFDLSVTHCGTRTERWER